MSLRTTNAYTGLYALDAFDVTERLHGHRRRPFQRRQHPPAGSARHRAERRRRLHALQSDDRRHLQDHAGADGLRRLFRSQSRADAAGARLRRSRRIPASSRPSSSPIRRCKQVVAHTVEAGLRGIARYSASRHSSTGSSASSAPTTSNDILNVADPVQQGFGYFQNVGSTRRQGIEAEVDYHKSTSSTLASQLRLYRRDASSTRCSSAPTRPFADANGNIQVSPGNRIPMIPHHRIKLSADYNVTDAFKIGGDVQYRRQPIFRRRRLQPIPQMPGLLGRQPRRVLSGDEERPGLRASVDNVFDNHYYTYGTFFDTTPCRISPTAARRSPTRAR